MNEFLGLLVTALSVLAAAIVSGLRLKPYIEAGQTYTPASFMLYPVLVTIAITAPLVLLLRRWQGKADINIGPLAFSDRMPFIALGCLVYVVVSLTCFPYQKPPEPPASSQPAYEEKPARPSQPVTISLPLSGQTVPVYLDSQR
jgi:hypothetical protein